MSRYLEQIREYISKLERRERNTLIGALLLSVVLLASVFYWASQATQSTVYSANDPSRVRAAAQALETAGIDYKVSEDGLRLTVPSENLGQARIATASVSSISGMEVLDNIKLGSSPQQERWIYLKALQGELTKTINSLAEVKASRVHIVEAERSAFANRADGASASVIVSLHSGQSLSNTQVQGIVSLVAGAVKGLKSSQVVLTDDTGQLLSGPTEEDQELSAVNSVDAARRKLEGKYKKTILDHLSRILGSPTNVSVAVTVDVVTDTTERNVTKLDPNSVVTISEKIDESSSKEEQPQGIPGAESNQPEQTPAEEESASQEKFRSQTNYGYSTESVVTRILPGAPKRVSVSVLVNSLAIEELINVSNGTETEADFYKKINQAVESSFGYDIERGDKVSVSYVPFPELTSSDDLVEASALNLERYLTHGLWLLVILLVFFGFIRPVTTSIVRTTELQRQLEIEALKGNGDDGDDPNSLARRLRRMVDNFETPDKKEINRLVEMNEQPSAEVIRRWLRAG